jgi:hypothetical protein
MISFGTSVRKTRLQEKQGDAAALQVRSLSEHERPQRSQLIISYVDS